MDTGNILAGGTSSEDDSIIILQSIELNNLRKKVNFFEKMGWVRSGTVYSVDELCYQKITQVNGFEISRPYLKEQTCSRCFHEFNTELTLDPCPICQVMSTPVTLDNGKVVTFNNDTVDLRTNKVLKTRKIYEKKPVRFTPIGWVIFLGVFALLNQLLGYLIGTGNHPFQN